MKKTDSALKKKKQNKITGLCSQTQICLGSNTHPYQGFSAGNLDDNIVVTRTVGITGVQLTMCQAFYFS